MRNALPDALARLALLHGAAVAFEDATTGATRTYATFEDRASRLATMLGERGVGAGDRVGILCRNRPEFFELLFACAKCGAILVPLNWRMPPFELDGLLVDCAPKLLVFGQEDAQTIGQLTVSVPHKMGLDEEGFEAVLARAPPFGGRSHWPHEDPWYLLYTSGTTGKPKAVIQTYGMALANHINTVHAAGLRAGDTTLNFLPLFHTAGINLYTLPTLLLGGRIVLLPGFDADRVVSLLREGRLDTFFAVPQVYQAISLHPDFDRIDFSTTRNMGCGGAPMPTTMADQFAKRGAQVINGYGMTETGPTCLFATPETMARKPGCAGRPQFLVSTRIVDREGQDVPAGQTGEMWVAGPAVTPGYWQQPQQTATAITADGWLRTGDLVRQDEDGDVFIIGRSKDMYISGGENVFPAEVEEVLNSHPDVLEAAVIGIPDTRWGEVGEAHILPRPGCRPDTEDLIRHARERLAAYKVPRSFVFVSDFPRTPSGKVIKHLLGSSTDEAGNRIP